MATLNTTNTLNIISKYNSRKIVGKVFMYLLIAIIITVVIFPFYWLVITSVKVGIDQQTSPPIYVPSRTTFENCEYKNADYIWQAYEAAAKVDVKAIVAKGYQGKAIKEQTEQQRISLIQAFKRFYNK